MDSELKLAFDRIMRKFDEIEARWEQRDRRFSPPAPEQLGAAQVIVADNWGGLFEPAPVMEERVYDPDATDYTSPPPKEEQQGVVVLPDNWGGLFEQPARTSEEPSFDLSANVVSMELASAVQICIPELKVEPMRLLDSRPGQVEYALSAKPDDPTWSSPPLRESVAALHVLDTDELEDIHPSDNGLEVEEVDEKVLPSTGNKVLEAAIADQFLTERSSVSALGRDSRTQCLRKSLVGDLPAPRPPRLRRPRRAPRSHRLQRLRHARLRPPRLRRPRRAPPRPPWPRRPRRAPPHLPWLRPPRRVPPCLLASPMRVFLGKSDPRVRIPSPPARLLAFLLIPADYLAGITTTLMLLISHHCLEFLATVGNWDPCQTTATTVLCGNLLCVLPEARKLFDEMPKRNAVSWTAVLFGFIQDGHVEDVEKLPMLDHTLAACNAMIIWFGQRRTVGAAKAVFDRICVRDNGSWGAIIKAHEQNDFLMEELSTFREMLHFGICPHCPSVISILMVCAAQAILDFGSEVQGAELLCSLDMDILVIPASLCTPLIFDKLPTQYTAIVFLHLSNGVALLGPVGDVQAVFVVFWKLAKHNISEILWPPPMQISNMLYIASVPSAQSMVDKGKLCYFSLPTCCWWDAVPHMQPWPPPVQFERADGIRFRCVLSYFAVLRRYRMIPVRFIIIPMVLGISIVGTMLVKLSYMVPGLSVLLKPVNLGSFLDIAEIGSTPRSFVVVVWLSNWLCSHLLWKPPWQLPALVEFADDGRPSGPVLRHTSGWPAFVLLFQLMCKGKEHWQFKQELFHQYLAFDSSLLGVLQILLYIFELHCSNHEETGNLCGMLITTTVQVHTCVVLAEMQFESLKATIRLPVEYELLKVKDFKSALVAILLLVPETLALEHDAFRVMVYLVREESTKCSIPSADQFTAEFLSEGAGITACTTVAVVWGRPGRARLRRSYQALCSHVRPRRAQATGQCVQGIPYLQCHTMASATATSATSDACSSSRSMLRLEGKPQFKERGMSGTTCHVDPSQVGRRGLQLLKVVRRPKQAINQNINLQLPLP